MFKIQVQNLKISDLTLSLSIDTLLENNSVTRFEASVRITYAYAYPGNDSFPPQCIVTCKLLQIPRLFSENVTVSSQAAIWPWLCP